MALRWVVHTACNVLGYDQNHKNIDCKSTAVVGYQQQTDHANGVTTTTTTTNKSTSSSSLISNGLHDPAGFQMPLHYPRYSKTDYEKMEEWKVDLLLREYGLSFRGNLDEKRAFAMGAFLWPDQY